MMALHLIAGIALLLVGRKLFWVFVGAVGFVAGFLIVSQLFPQQPEWLVLVVAVIAGLIGVFLAIFLQRVAIFIAGFLAAGYVGVALMNALALQAGQYTWVVFVVAGIIGAILASLLFDWALIILSSAAGALVIVQVLPLQPPVITIAGVLLFVFGVALQAGMMRGEETPPPAQAKAT